MKIKYQRLKQKRFSYLIYFVVTLLMVTTVSPVIAQHPTSINTSHPKEVAQQRFNYTQLLQQGKQSYQRGQFYQAVNFWKQAEKQYQSQGAILNQTQALNYLSLAYQDLGQWENAQKAIAKSLNLLQSFEKLDKRGIALFAQALNTQGSLQLAKGQTEEALESWKQAETNYNRAENETGKLGSRINQAQALQTLGQYRRAKSLLESLVEELKAQPDSLLKADGLRSLGVALQTIGDFLQSKEILEQSWAISQQLNSTIDTSATLFSIGNTARDLKQYDVALAYYQEAAEQAIDEIFKVQAQLNQLNLLVETQKWQDTISLVPEIESSLLNLSPSRPSIYAKVNLAESLMKIEEISRINTTLVAPQIDLITNPAKIAQLLATAIQQGRQISDPRAEAYSLNQLGKLYENSQQWKEAQSLTEQALRIAQGINADDLTARASWQLGRILKQQEDIKGAIAAYQNSLDTLQSLRSDLVAINTDVQFNFTESVEPVYRELASLLLTPPDQGEVSQTNLKQARQVLEALQLAELDNFFRDACLDTEPVEIDQIDPQAAVIYPIILSDRLEVILSLPNQTLRHYTTQLSLPEVEATLQQMYSSLYLGYSGEERLRLSEEVYNWLVKPAEEYLAKSNIKTLIFVPDGFLRNLPMGALYDGKQYLIEKYSLSLSPGLQLFPEGLENEKISALAVGLTEARQGFSELPAVKKEVNEIASLVDSRILLNEEFTSTTLREQINTKPFPIVHLATHGQFSSNQKKTFLLTWNDRIGVKDLDKLFQKRRLGLIKPVELLILSACQTASGDKRATLGLAGLALRSGARSTIASLWSVNDQSTADLMSAFYQQLAQPNSEITKAEALRQAQLTLLKDSRYNHPYFWASFVLVGNWL
ncbi:MAG: CHAT domain-containing protein [Moorea sp. SIO2B7]|nr:CHAT domain-containing protein [Moorena sp. SIO2B7]